MNTPKNFDENSAEAKHALDTFIMKLIEQDIERESCQHDFVERQEPHVTGTYWLIGYDYWKECTKCGLTLDHKHIGIDPEPNFY